MENTIRARVIRIGNSRGIRIPKIWLEQLGLKDEVELAIRNESLVVRSARAPRGGWASAFQEMAEHGDDKLLDEPHATKWDKTEWHW